VSTDEIRRLALELDPVVGQVGNVHPRMFRLSTAVEVLGWDRATEDYPDARRFLDRLGAVVAENVENEGVIRVLRRQRDDAREAGEALLEHTRKQRERIEKALRRLENAEEFGDEVDIADLRADLTGESES
jgi:hypothetical protein